MEQAEGRLEPVRVFQLAQRKPGRVVSDGGGGESGKHRELGVPHLCCGMSVNVLTSFLPACTPVYSLQHPGCAMLHKRSRGCVEPGTLHCRGLWLPSHKLMPATLPG